MEFRTRWFTGCLLAGGMAAVAPAWSASLAPTVAGQPMPAAAALPVMLPEAEHPTAGSGALVPLMAADLPADRVSALEAATVAGGGDVGKPIDDLSFLARATETGRRESSAARDALPRLTDPELKRLAEQLARHHDEANARMAQIAERKMWPLPASQKRDARASGTTSADFDELWTDDTIAAHERALALYQAQAQGGEDPDLRRYARETLTELEHHLAELRRLQK